MLSCVLVRRRNVLLERYASFGGAWWAVPIKIVLDQTIFALYLNGAYCAMLELMSRSSPRQTWRRVKQAAWPSLVSSWRFWPAVHALTFSVVPVHLRVLWVDAIEIVWVAILSMAVTGSSDAVDEDVCVPAQCVAVMCGQGPGGPIAFRYSLIMMLNVVICYLASLSLARDRFMCLVSCSE